MFMEVLSIPSNDIEFKIGYSEMFQKMPAEGSAQAKAAESEISEPDDVNPEKSKSSLVKKSGDSGVLQTAEVQFVQLLSQILFLKLIGVQTCSSHRRMLIIDVAFLTHLSSDGSGRDA